MKKILSLCFLGVTLSSLLFSQTKTVTAKSLIDAASKKSSIEESLSYLKKNVSSVTVNAEKRAVYAFLAAILEQQGQYAEAQKNYVQAASIQGSADSVVAGVPNKNSEQLVIDAVRCSLSAGDYSSAESYLNSAVRNSKDEKILAYVKLYEQWGALCKAKNESETKESIALLKTYATLDSMKSLRPSILLTLWHLTGEAQFSENLKKNFPKSMETAIVKGEVQTFPTPFWYFVPRSGVDLPEISNEGSLAPVVTSANLATEKSEKAVRLQLGLFREEANAKALVDRVAAKGFKAQITTEIRPSGTKYYLVVVNENSKGTVGEELRTAGFDCYPLFE
ncbi:MAG: SPOR domain-containing protein [Treponema sp.]|uniref:SPOR domain-containing protein n=1 Tax=Treponema sp. TaxID=166 RepID=UPI001B27B26B|nr:SPOR domain-containing protein [Treponema sp.]MBO6218813.1 SPOR domain-containing protein [Treponema sp.]MBQ8679800.1 SPOR domain-containing protein [Treponema sp.]